MPNPTPGQPPRDLKTIALSVASNPSIGKKMLRSRAFSSHRRAVQSKGAMASYVAGAGKKLASFGFGQIPLPVVGSVLDTALGIAYDMGKSARLSHNCDHAISDKDKIKFSLKGIGGEVEKWDRYRWKITHAIEQCNKAETAAGGGPCDRVVRLWAKRKYLDFRITKLQVSLLAVKSIVEATQAWLDTVTEGGAVKTEKELISGVGSHLTSIRTGDHSTCHDVYCMYGKTEWTSQKSIPGDTMTKFLVKPAGAVSSAVLMDPLGTALGEL